MPQMGGRWLGAVPSGLNYPPRRDMSGLGGGQIRSSWDTRGIPPAFLSSQLKTSAAMRCALLTIEIMWAPPQVQRGVFYVMIVS